MVPAVCVSKMAFVGRRHPPVIHFPIALVSVAVVAAGALVAVAGHLGGLLVWGADFRVPEGGTCGTNR